jgi:hypothetical protein
MNPRNISNRVRWEVIKRDGFKCSYCGASGVQLVVDHARSVADGGGNRLVNLRAACLPCNIGKGRQSIPFTPGPPKLLSMNRREYVGAVRTFRDAFYGWREITRSRVEELKSAAYGCPCVCRSYELNCAEEIIQGEYGGIKLLETWIGLAAKARVPERDCFVYVWQCFREYEIHMDETGAIDGR